MAISWVDPRPVLKLFIKDLIDLKKCDDGWRVNLENGASPIILHDVHLQIEVVKLSGMQNEVMLVTDNTGKAKVTRGSNVPGEFSWIQNGSHCSVIGSLVVAGKIPHIQATKIGRVDNKALIAMWPHEVKELRQYLSHLVIPDTSNQPIQDDFDHEFG